MQEMAGNQLTVFNPSAGRRTVEALETEFGSKKKYARGYKRQILTALSHYPELKDITIHFVFNKSERPLSSKPTRTSTLLPAGDRIYQVFISTDISSPREPILLRNLNFSLQVGQIAHELGHITDYLKKSSVRLLADGVLYSVPQQRRDMEQFADTEAIRHGFGHQILAFSELIYELMDWYPHEKYYQDYHNYYMTPDEVKKKMNQMKIYQTNRKVELTKSRSARRKYSV